MSLTLKNVACAIFLCSGIVLASEGPSSDDTVDCYLPIEGGWAIHLSPDPNAPRAEPGSRIGVVDRASSYGEGHAFYQPGQGDNPRLHRRPLYPPADKSLVWSQAERAKFPQCGFRPLVLAYNEPRFLFDFHAAGGLLGHLYIGLMREGGPSKWFHQWADLNVSYVDGRMEYVLKDPEFPNVTIRLVAGALAASVGLVVKVEVEGAEEHASLVWAYGGASAFFTNYAMTDPHFNFAPEQCAKDVVAWKSGAEHPPSPPSRGEWFSLTRAFDKNDSIMEQVFAAARFMPDWKALVEGGSSRTGESGFGDPSKFVNSPAELVKAADFADSARMEKTNCVAVQRIPLRKQKKASNTPLRPPQGDLFVIHRRRHGREHRRGHPQTRSRVRCDAGAQQGDCVAHNCPYARSVPQCGGYDDGLCHGRYVGRFDGNARRLVVALWLSRLARLVRDELLLVDGPHSDGDQELRRAWPDQIRRRCGRDVESA